MANTVGALEPKRFGATGRRDAWWAQPAATFIVLGLFVIYATWAAFLGGGMLTWSPNDIAADQYGSHTYLSPFYSPTWLYAIGESLFGPLPPVFAILWIPLGFRFTCYFARRTYYRGFTGDPVACAVSEFSNRKYNGESKLLMFQNLHRYFLYFAIMLVFFHWFDIFHAFRKVNLDGTHSLHVGIGSIVLLADALFLTLYVFSCHSVRHLIGGKLNRFTNSDGGERPRHKLWRAVSRINEQHGLYFWLSLFAVGFADFYVRFLAKSFG